MTPQQLMDWILSFMVLWLGACIGSFLNVVIYRLPRDLSVNEPRRSFCPSCGKTIPLRYNLPVISWLWLRGRCAMCGAAISVRYLLVEVLVALLFFAVFKVAGGAAFAFQDWLPAVVVGWVLMSLLVAGTFIDFEFYILPHSITLGGTLCGLLAAVWVPERWMVGDRWHALALSGASAAFGLGLLWLVVELGKLAFGRRRMKLDAPTPWAVLQPSPEQSPIIRVGDEDYPWEEIFTRKTDRLLIHGAEIELNGESIPEATMAELSPPHLRLMQDKKELRNVSWEAVQQLGGKVTSLVIPREAMGFGDVLFIMMIGSFLGWQAVLFSIFAASVVGTIVALIARLLRFAEWSQRIPFGPYLALGALIWFFVGPQMVAWYFNLLRVEI